MENINVLTVNGQSYAIRDSRVDDLTGQPMKLIKTVTVEESGMRTLALDDDFCLRKFLVIIKAPAQEGVTTSAVQVSFMEKLESGGYNSFGSFPQSLIVNNSPRYAAYWGSTIASQPAEIYVIPASQYEDMMTGIQSRPVPRMVNRGLTRILFYGLTEGTEFPLGTTVELWGMEAA